MPKVAIGTPDSWDRTIAVSGKDQYDGPCIWSPCGRFVAARTKKAVEIRNQLTLELITTLQPAETIRHLVGPLAYSPDDVPSPAPPILPLSSGISRRVEWPKKSNVAPTLSHWCGRRMDGRFVPSIRGTGGPSLCIHTMPPQARHHPQAHSSQEMTHTSGRTYGSFRVMTTVRGGYPENNTIDVFKVESTLTKIESFTFPPSLRSEAKITSFSPDTHHISISDGNTLQIFDIRNQERLLAETGNFLSHCFSPSGYCFAASQESGVHVWVYDDDRVRPVEGIPVSGLVQFSPSILTGRRQSWVIPGILSRCGVWMNPLILPRAIVSITWDFLALAPMPRLPTRRELSRSSTSLHKPPSSPSTRVCGR
jgi:hypothetical protein